MRQGFTGVARARDAALRIEQMGSIGVNFHANAVTYFEGRTLVLPRDKLRAF